jgi:hypothetical protein
VDVSSWGLEKKVHIALTSVTATSVERLFAKGTRKGGFKVYEG